MAELPRFERQGRIQPAGAVGGFAKAASELGQVSTQIGQLGYDIAKNAAMERATIEGVKAGQKPGRALFPSFTDADKAFTNAYKQEEYNTVARHADKYLSQIYFDVAKNPNPESLELFRQNGMKQIDELSNIVAEDSRPALKRSLEADFESKYYQLAGAVKTRADRDLKTNFALNVENQAERIQESAAMGAVDKAQADLEESTNYILSLVGTEAVPTNEVAQDKIKEQVKIYERSLAQNKLHDAQQQGKESEFLAERAALPPTMENMQTNAALYQQHAMHNNLISMQSHLARNDALELARTNSLTDIAKDEYKSKMTELDRSNFDLEVQKINLNGLERSQNIQYVKQNANNDVALANVDGKTMDSVLDNDVSDFQKLQGRVPQMQEIASMASQYEAPVPSFNKQLGAMINSRNPQMAAQGASIYESLRQQQPRAVDNISKEDEARASLINSAIDTGDNPTDAVNTVNEKLADLRKVDIENRRAAYKETLRSTGLNQPSLQEGSIAYLMGYKKELIPSGLYTDFMRNLENYYVMTGDFKESQQLAKKAIDRVYKKTNINGFDQVMWQAPNGNDIYLQNLAIEKSEALFKAQKELFDNPESGASYYYQLDYHIVSPEKEGESIFQQRRLRTTGIAENKGPIPIVKVDSEGKEVKGSLYISSDDATSLPLPGEAPSYGMYFIPEGKNIPSAIYAANDIGNMARFSVNQQDVQKANNIRQQKREKLYQEELFNRKVEKYIKGVTEKQRSIREIVGESEYEQP